MKSRILQFVIPTLFIMFFILSCEKDPEPAPEALNVTSVSPVSNAVDVSISTTIKVDFSRAIDGKTTAGVSLLKGQSIIATTSSASGSSVTLTPSTPLENNVSYTVVAKGIKATDGVVASDYTSTFTTIKSPFIVESVTPADKGVGVRTDAKVVIKFNKKLSTATQTGTGITITDKDSKAIIVTASYDGANTLTLTPKEALNSSEVYKVIVKGATAEDNSVVTDFTSSFTVEKIPFTIISITPADKTTGVGVNTKIVIVFSKKLNATIANGMEFVVAGMNVSTSFTTAYDGKATITLTPSTPMVKNTIYSVFISDLSPLYSLDGDKLEKVNVNFTTEK